MAVPMKKLLLGAAMGTLVAACSNGHNRHSAPYAPHGQQGSYNYYSQYATHTLDGHAGYAPQQPSYAQPQTQGYYAQDGYNPQAQSVVYAAYNDGAYSAYPNAKGYRYSEAPPLFGNEYRGSKFSYESLNAFEAPVATEIAGITFELRGRIDAIADTSLEYDGDTDTRIVGSHRLTAEKQLPNRFTIGASWIGRGEDLTDGNVDYINRYRAHIGGSWGTFIGGNVQNLVYEDTRRLRGAARNVGFTPREELLRGEGALGRLADWGGGYHGRFGPTTVTTVIDEDSNYDLGVRFQRPIGNKDYRLTARHNTGSFTAADGLTEIDTKAVTGVAEYVYGSTRYDVSGGYEQLENTAAGIDSDRWFASGGVTTKMGVLSLTAEGLYGETDGQPESSAVLAAKYDITRGLSATAAIDYHDRQVTIGGTNVLNEKDTRAIVGLSYGF